MLRNLSGAGFYCIATTLHPGARQKLSGWDLRPRARLAWTDAARMVWLLTPNENGL